MSDESVEKPQGRRLKKFRREIGSGAAAVAGAVSPGVGVDIVAITWCGIRGVRTLPPVK